MNLRELKKNVGHQLRLRPLPYRAEDDGTRLASIDDYWRLDGIHAKPNRLRLVNVRTGHFVDLQSDNVKQFQSPDFLILRCQLTLTSKQVRIEPLLPAGRAILPIARYQRKGNQAVTSRYVPVRPEVCDGCTAAVQFRPLIGIQLMNADGTSEQPEQFCPPCARKRGIAVPAPIGMTAEVLYADQNPSLRYHISLTFKNWGLRALSEDPDIRVLGVSNVGAAISADWITFLVAGDWPKSIEVSMPLLDLERAALASDMDLVATAKAQILETIAHP